MDYLDASAVMVCREGFSLAGWRLRQYHPWLVSVRDKVHRNCGIRCMSPAQGWGLPPMMCSIRNSFALCACDCTNSGCVVPLSAVMLNLIMRSGSQMRQMNGARFYAAADGCRIFLCAQGISAISDSLEHVLVTFIRTRPNTRACQRGVE